MRAKQLFLIRIALMTGVAAFAALTVYQRSRMDASLDVVGGGSALPMETLRYAFWGLAGIAVAVALLLRSRIETATLAQRMSFLIVGWAFGEGVALFATVLHFIGGPLSTMVVGLVTFVVVLMLLPIPPD